MEPLTLVFLGLAVFVIWKLRSVLGQRNEGGPPRQPYEPPLRRDASPPADDGKVVSLPGRGPAPPREAPPAPANRFEDFAKPGTPLARGLETLVKADPNFDPKAFISGARAAYEMIVSAFGQGDRKTLQGLLSRDVFEGFDAAIKDRESRGEKVETTFVSIDTAEMADAQVRDRQAQVTMRFVSQLITATRDRDGKVVDGNAEKVVEVTDVWTFARDVASREPSWLLVATGATG